MRKAIAVGLVAALLAPSVAFASETVEYPRFIERDGLICVQLQGSDGAINETCRPADGTQPKAAAPATNYRQPRPAPRGPHFDGRQGRRLVPVQAAATDAGQVSAGGAFAGGLVAGITLGLIGTAVAGVVANSSSVVPPPSPPGYSDVEQWQYHSTYVNEVQGKRTTNAVVGGLLGTGITVVAIILILQSAE